MASWTDLVLPLVKHSSQLNFASITVSQFDRVGFQQTIASVTDATHLTLSTAAPTFPSGAATISTVGYSVSDPCDVPAALWDCFKTGCYAELAQFCSPKEYMAVRARYATALRSAKAADNFNRTKMGVGTGVQTISRLRDNPNRPVLGG
jgi:hypothetical protein